MALVTVRNVSNGPVTIDRAGRILPTGGYGSAEVEHAPARGLLERGVIRVIEPRDDDKVSDEARSAFAETDRRNSGAEADEPAQPVDGAPADETGDTDAGAATTATGRRTRRTTPQEA